MQDIIHETSSPAQEVRRVRCSLCWAPPGEPCQRRPRADHLQRWLDAYRDGLLSKAELGQAISALVIITRWQVVPEAVAA
jgi:hypothetical protein